MKALKKHSISLQDIYDYFEYEEQCKIFPIDDRTEYFWDIGNDSVTFCHKKGNMIWDSFFGYELGYFVSESDEYMYNSHKIYLVTGSVEGETLRSKDEIIPYNEDTIKEMIKKYGYTKTF